MVAFLNFEGSRLDTVPLEAEPGVRSSRGYVGNREGEQNFLQSVASLLDYMLHECCCHSCLARLGLNVEAVDWALLPIVKQPVAPH